MEPIPTADERPVLTVDEVVEAGWLGLSRSSLYAGVADGSIPSLRVRGRILIPTAQLREWLGLASS